MPGKLINDEKKEKTRLVLPKKFQSNNIFDNKEDFINYNNNCNNSFVYGKSFKRSSEIINCFETTNREKDLFEKNKRSRRPNGIKNAFQSQIGILK